MIKVGIVGGTGYVGVELLRLLVQHPGVALSVITSRVEAGRRVDHLFPNLRGHIDLSFSDPSIDVLSDCDVVFYATPNGVAMTQVPKLLARGVRVIDLAADFRLKEADVWSEWYGMVHACPMLLDEAVYGLPEMNRNQITSAQLVANPGCYPTAVQLGFLPLVEAGLIETSSLIADGKSGVSGAGRQANVGTLFCEAGESFKAYGVSGHRHLPEIVQGLKTMGAGDSCQLTFVPHLTPMIRGIHATLYAQLNDSTTDLQALFEARYENESFVDVVPSGCAPEVRSVRGSNMCQMAVYRPAGGNTVVVLSVIDNLVKGAAGQAVQNMNIMFGQEESVGLKQVALLP